MLRSGDTIEVELMMRYPEPCQIRTTVEYTQLLNHYRCPIPPLSVELIDLLCKLPTLNFSPHLVFDVLWRDCEDKHASGISLVTILKPYDGVGFKLGTFRLPPAPGPEDNEIRYMFGLPPNHFVLIRSSVAFPSVKIAVDATKVLPVVYKLLTTGTDCD